MANDSTSKRKWVATFRIVTMSLVLSLGGFGCLVLFGGLLLGCTPFEPPTGVSFEEHMRRTDSGYYTVQEWKQLAIMVAYLGVVSIPHRWIVRSRVAFIVTIIVLALPLFAYVGGIIELMIQKWPDRAAFIERFQTIDVAFDSLCVLFCLMIPLSLFFSWIFRDERYAQNTQAMSV